MRVLNVARWAAGAVMLCAIAWPARPAAAFVTFETGQVRPLALHARRRARCWRSTRRTPAWRSSPSTAATPRHVGSVPVGLEPVAVAARTNTEVWVVNHLSDSVSIVDLGATPPRVVRTLLVGDEPRDIVFAGPTDADGHFTRAFITTARRRPEPARLACRRRSPRRARRARWSTSSTPRNLGTALGGTPRDDHRALRRHAARARRVARRPHRLRRGLPVRQPDRRRSPRARSATAAPARAVCDVDGVQVPGGLADGAGARRPAGAEREHRGRSPAPEVGLIVQAQPEQRHLGGRARPQLDQRRALRSAGPRRLPHRRARRPAARGRPPSRTSAPCSSTWSSIRPTARSTSATPRRATRCASRARARSARPCAAICTRARITVIDGANVAAAPPQQAHHARCRRATARCRCRPASRRPASPRRSTWRSPATARCTSPPSARAPSASSTPASSRTTRFVPDAAQHIAVSGGGPSGLALDEANHRLYVLTRFDNAVKVIDTTTRQRDRRSTRCTIPSRRRSSTGGASSTTRASRRATARRRAPPATSSPTSTAWPGTSATPTTS